ncbi:MAG: RsmE family RNA methyltransferase [Candidatus Omnitrophota bacterium]
MPADRFFTPVSLKTSSLSLEGEELHHLAKVMRVRPGETIELVNGRGELATAELISLDKKTAHLKILSHETATPPPPLILAQAVTRTASLEWIIEKGTELGATEFWLFPGEKSEKKNLALQRLETIQINALKQCGRLFLPHLALKPPLQEWPPPSGSLFFGDLSPHAPPLKGPFDSPVIFFIGPEKGFSTSELATLSRFKARGISLHSNILRAETAAIAALAQFYTAFF